MILISTNIRNERHDTDLIFKRICLFFKKKNTLMKLSLMDINIDIDTKFYKSHPTRTRILGKERKEKIENVLILVVSNDCLIYLSYRFHLI